MSIRSLAATAVLLSLAACAGGPNVTNQGCLYNYCFVTTQSGDKGSGPLVVTQMAIPQNGQNGDVPIVASGAGESFIQGFFKGTGPALALGGFAAVAAAQSDPDQTEINQSGGGANVGDVSANSDSSAEGGIAVSDSHPTSISGVVANTAVVNQNRVGSAPRGAHNRSGKNRGRRPGVSVNQGGCVQTGFCSN